MAFTRVGRHLRSTLYRVLPLMALGVATSYPSIAQTQSPAIGAAATIHGIEWDLHEMTIGQVKAAAKATRFLSRAEQEGGGYIFESGWTKKPTGTGGSPLVCPVKIRNPQSILLLMKPNQSADFSVSDCQRIRSGRRQRISSNATDHPQVL